MNEGTKPAPFQVGDHVRFVARKSWTLPAGHGNSSELVLVPGMEGVVMLSTGPGSDAHDFAPNPWRCQVQFDNGFQVEITPENLADFEVAVHEAASTI